MMTTNGYAVQTGGWTAGVLGSGMIFSAPNRTVRNRSIRLTAAGKKTAKRSFSKANG